ncbi:unnamed protein product [Pedinophyceae sp. YPF-701]|nr:unnamed protein product [Pedinophyceae sp. YPF-701]
MAGYWDVEAIFAETHAVPARFSVPAPGLGHALDGDLGDHDLPQGTRVNLPLWLVPELAARHFVTVPAMPKTFGKAVRRDLEAESAAVALRSRCPHFYTAATKLGAAAPGLRADANDPDEKPLHEFALLTFEARFRGLVAQSFRGDSLGGCDPRVLRMTNEERRLHDLAQISQRMIKHWEFDERRMHAYKERSRRPLLGLGNAGGREKRPRH